VNTNKILIVSHNCFSKVSNNGKTLESIFSTFSKDEIAQLFFNDDSTIDFEYCSNYFKITDLNVLISLLSFKSICGENISKTNLKNKKNSNKLFSYSFKSKTVIFSILRDLLWSSGKWKSPNLFEWINNFNPDIIFFVGGNYEFSHNIAYHLSVQYNRPLVSYFTDDYVLNPQCRNIVERYQRSRMVKYFSKTIEHSSMCFAIGYDMANEYSMYFKKIFLPLMNSVEREDYIPYLNNRKVLVISYFGGLHLNRWQMIIRLARVINGAVINIYTIDIPSDDILLEFQKYNIVYKGTVEGDYLKNEIIKSDVLLHVESDDKYYRSLTKLSVSTKIPEYLISGRLVLGFGPMEVASMRLLEAYNIGIVISSSITDNELKLELDKVISNYLTRYKIGLNGYEYAIENFDKSKNSYFFKTNIKKLISKYEN
jgi:hypothetical protein